MTNLTAAAQAVIYAWSKIAYDDKVDITFNPLPWEHKAIAAALRTAVDLVVSDKSPPIEDFNEFDQGYSVAHITHRQALLAIADELEGIKYGTYRCNILDKNND